MRGYEVEGGEGDDVIAELNVIPLVDIMLVLLIVFMVAAPLPFSGIAVQVPRAGGSQEPVAGAPVTLTVSAGGGFYLGEEAIEEADLVDRLRQMLGGDNKPALYIRGDASVPYQRIVAAMSAGRQAGASSLAMVTQHDPASRH